MTSSPVSAGIRQVRIALGAGLLLGVASAQAALTPFVFDPVAAGLGGSSTISADNIQIYDYASVITSGSSFTETGYLQVSGFGLAGGNVLTPDLNNAYSLYFKFTAVGTTSAVGPYTVGTLSSLSYTLYGNPSVASFSFDASHMPQVTASGSPIALASGSLGSLGSGGIFTQPTGSTTASATVEFQPVLAAFFSSPTPFANGAETAFSNTGSQVVPFTGGFEVNQGSGTINFVTLVPEPGTFAMFLAGLGVMGFLASRRGGTRLIRRQR